MLIDLECPIELTGFELLHDDRSNARVYVRLRNLSEKTVVGFDAIVRWLRRSSDESGELNYTAEALNVPPREHFTVSFFAAGAPGVDDIEMAFTKIGFDKSDDWSGDLDRVKNIPTPPSPGKALNALIAVAGEDAVCFPSEAEDWWQCVCGRPNEIGRERCVRCHRGKDQVLSALTRKAVLSGDAPWLPETLRPEGREIETPFPLDIPEQPEPTPEESIAYAPTEADQTRFRRQRSLLIRRTITLIVLAVLIVFITMLWSFLSESKERVGEVIPPVPIETHDPDKPI